MPPSPSHGLGTEPWRKKKDGAPESTAVAVSISDQSATTTTISTVVETSTTLPDIVIEAVLSSLKVNVPDDDQDLLCTSEDIMEYMLMLKLCKIKLNYNN